MAPKAHVLVASIPIYGHFEKLRIVAADLVARGYPTTFLTGTCQKSKVLATGANFVPLEDFADYDFEKDITKLLPLRNTLPKNAQVIYDCTDLFIPSMPGQYKAVQKFLKSAAERGERVVVVGDTVFMGVHPTVLGAEGLKPAGSIGIGITPLLMPSVDTGKQHLRKFFLALIHALRDCLRRI